MFVCYWICPNVSISCQYLYDISQFVWQCETEAGRNELTRVAVVNEQRECVYETLVKPRNQITNYLTQYVTFSAHLCDHSSILQDR